MPIVFQGRSAGNLYLISDTNELESRVRSYLGIVGAVLLASLVAAFLVSRASQRRISNPMIKLADTAKLVSSLVRRTQGDGGKKARSPGRARHKL